MIKEFKNKTLLITGGTGSLGKSLINELLKKKYALKKIIIYSRDELKQHELKILYPTKKYPSLRFFIGDIRDRERLSFALRDTDIVIHAAALKQVESSEYNPFEFVKTNVTGTQNVVDACLSSNVKKAILVSTDKAVAPANLYGATKLCAEKIFISSDNIKGKQKIAFAVVRYGNVLGSRGSVLHEFIKQKKNGKFFITDLEMTRFDMKLEQSVNFVINSTLIAKGGEIFVPKLPSFYIKDLAKAICAKTALKEIGAKPGEKIHEVLMSVNEYCRAVENKNFYIIRSGYKKIFTKNIKNKFEYSSINNKSFLTIAELRNNIKYFLKN